MKNRLVHIVSFAIPDPPDYGGVIDVFYKVKVLSELGIQIKLHCFQYDDRKESKVLNELCEEVHYYKRDTSWKKAVGTTPFIVASRYNEALIKRLNEDNYPILFEGMHTLGNANHPSLRTRKKAVRMHNIEWNYYSELAKQGGGLKKRLYYITESWKLYGYRSTLRKLDTIFTISNKDQQRLSTSFSNCVYLPAFHNNETVKIPNSVGKHILYHGNLEVAENQKAVEFLLKQVFPVAVDLPLIIAGKCSEKNPIRGLCKNVQLVANPSDEELSKLIEEAQIHVLPTFQATGIKLKLIHALYKGRHVVVNPRMVEGTGLEDLCEIAVDATDFQGMIKKLSNQPIDEPKRLNRIEILGKTHSNKVGAEVIVKEIF